MRSGGAAVGLIHAAMAPGRTTTRATTDSEAAARSQRLQKDLFLMLPSPPQRISAVFVALATYPAAHEPAGVAVGRCQTAGNALLAAFTADRGL